MVKFGKKLLESQHSPWDDHYIDYKRLKKLLSKRSKSKKGKSKHENEYEHEYEHEYSRIKSGLYNQISLKLKTNNEFI